MSANQEILVIKVGTSVLTDPNDIGQLDLTSFERIGQQIIDQQDHGRHVAIVSSAAIAAGMAATGTTERPHRYAEIPEAQRLASIGWRHVLAAWAGALPGKHIGEVLLTRSELHEQSPRKEVLGFLQTLFGHGDIAVTNENDAISHQEISFGDNDLLASRLAAQLHKARVLDGADVKLVLLSDVDGLYADPSDSSSIVRLVKDTRPYMEAAGNLSSRVGSGGMKSKLLAANSAAQEGVDTFLANGRTENAIARTLAGEIGTHFALSH